MSPELINGIIIVGASTVVFYFARFCSRRDSAEVMRATERRFIGEERVRWWRERHSIAVHAGMRRDASVWLTHFDDDSTALAVTVRCGVCGQDWSTVVTDDDVDDERRRRALVT